MISDYDIIESWTNGTGILWLISSKRPFLPDWSGGVLKLYSRQLELNRLKAGVHGYGLRSMVSSPPFIVLTLAERRESIRCVMRDVFYNGQELLHEHNDPQRICGSD